MARLSANNGTRGTITAGDCSAILDATMGRLHNVYAMVGDEFSRRGLKREKQWKLPVVVTEEDVFKMQENAYKRVKRVAEKMQSIGIPLSFGSKLSKLQRQFQSILDRIALLETKFG